jgi:hypothetical protein
VNKLINVIDKSYILAIFPIIVFSDALNSRSLTTPNIAAYFPNPLPAFGTEKFGDKTEFTLLRFYSPVRT